MTPRDELLIRMAECVASLGEALSRESQVKADLLREAVEAFRRRTEFENRIDSADVRVFGAGKHMFTEGVLDAKAE